MLVMWNGNSAYSNGNSFCLGADDRRVRSLPWLFRVGVAGLESGWPAK